MCSLYLTCSTLLLLQVGSWSYEPSKMNERGVKVNSSRKPRSSGGIVVKILLEDSH